MPSRNQFDQLWLDMAAMAARLSKDPSTKAGALVVKDDLQLSVGYNGMPRGMPETPELWERPMKYELVVHAELNAILNAPFDTRGATIYCTHQPCHRCLVHLINAGVVRIVYRQPYANMAPDARHVWDLTIQNAPNLKVEYLP